MKQQAYQLFKHSFDFLAAAITLCVFSPLYIVVALLIYQKMGSPIFFHQQRIGKGNRVFNIFKFRTMRNQTTTSGYLLSDFERLTPLGKFMRKYSLDELPQLFNILRGEMSFVGPRPLLTQYLPLYSNIQRRRHEVRSGITGYAQINGRNAISWKEKLNYDVYYVDNQSLWLDIKIICLTIWKVLRPEGVNQQDNSTTMDFFTGEN